MASEKNENSHNSKWYIFVSFKAKFNILYIGEQQSSGDVKGVLSGLRQFLAIESF